MKKKAATKLDVKIGVRFKLPPFNDMTDKMFDRAMMTTLNFRGKGRGGNMCWLDKVDRSRQIQIYELLQERKTIGSISKYVLKQKWCTYPSTPIGLRNLLSLWGNRLEKHFINFEEERQKIINKNLPSVPEEYMQPIDYSKYPVEEAKLIAGMLRNIVRMEQRVIAMMTHEGHNPLKRYDNADVTKAMHELHVMQKELVTTLRQAMWEGSPMANSGPAFNSSNYTSLFGSESKAKKMEKAADTFLTLMENKTIPLLKGADGTYSKVKAGAR